MFDELQKLGARALAAPVLFAVVIVCVLGLALTPVMRASVSEAAFIIVNLDEGGITVAGNSNVGETLTENLLSGSASLTGSDDESESGSGDTASSLSIEWTEMDSEEEALEALGGFDYYGALVIPENFTSQQMAAAVGAGDAPELTVYLNAGKNPQMASSMRVTLTDAMLSAGLTVDVETVNDADLGDGAMSSVVAVQLLVMPLMILSLVMSLLLSLSAWHNDATGLRKRNRGAAVAMQIALAAVFSAVAAGSALFIEIVFGGMDLPAARLFFLLWLAGFCVMLAFSGLCDLSFPLGALVSILIVFLGMGTALLAAEMLPAFWADWVCPWVPQAHLGQAVRSVVYFGAAPLQSDMSVLLAYGLVGLIALAVAALIPGRAASGRASAERDASAPVPEGAPGA